MNRKPFLWVLLAAGFLAALAAVAVLVGQADRPKPDPDLSGAAMMATTLPSVDGKLQSLAQWQGKVLVLNFWATWCGPCKEEMPMLSKIAPNLATNGVQVIGIAADNRENVAKFLEKLGISYPSLVGDEAAIAFSRRLGNRLGVLPYTVFVDRRGDIVYRKIGKMDEDEVVKMSQIASKNIPSSSK